MAREDRGFILNHYTTFNGTKLTRQELSERILKLLSQGSMTCGNIARTLKVTNQTIYNITNYMMRDRLIDKSKDEKGIYVYRKVQECLLDSLFRPSAKNVEKSFKVKGKQKRTVGDGTSKGYGNNNVTYTENHYNSVYWGE